jgi:hypothetical protein
MPKKTDPYRELQEQIDQLIELLDKILKDDEKMGFETRLTTLDTASRVAANLARSIKTVRDLQRDEVDAADLLRQALRELEDEWPELRDCKETLRSGGASSGGAVTPTEVNNAAQV